ncbi:Sec-independent protein translocase subunit TatA [Streptacidiphilus cavernicola]|uniref:Sec-independent protein translocase protein TatA n=1 Tax=Streptacidiphilus cavernicola TaxID=3342716 RepID=A0ABV6VW22_9ACTN
MLENRGLEILIIAVVVLLLFGAKRLPDSARALGKSLRILKSETQAMRTDSNTDNDTPAPAAARTGATSLPTAEAPRGGAREESAQQQPDRVG